MNDSGRVAKVRLTCGGKDVNGPVWLVPFVASSGPYGGGTAALSLTLPGNGALSVRFGSVRPLASASPGCVAHCVSPTCAAIIAIAFGVDGPVAVWWKLSNNTKRSAYCHRNGIVSQSTCDITTSPFCLVCSVGFAVGARPLAFTIGAATPEASARVVQSFLVERIAVVQRRDLVAWSACMSCR